MTLAVLAAALDYYDLAIQRHLTTFSDQGRKRRFRPPGRRPGDDHSKTPPEVTDGLAHRSDKATYSDLVLARVGIGPVMAHVPAADPDTTKR